MCSFERACPSPPGFTVGPQPRWFKSQDRTRNFVIDEVSFITDEIIGGINELVAVMQTR
jgi:hypothetical protein